ncbi:MULTISPECIES: hypothetical protein [Yersinia]|uniref:Uncharacterized protein n=2 Tax=Yersinia TaxID=629 RepID=A0A0T9QWV2_9GAMM|nr:MULTISPECIES: hypothetical protein [Yersinia]MBO1551378.1 hypothetical protein [Yersinia pseudotuberculosis]MBO1562454.1 hypothetical protein [Yersinia pseudotuberculosis]MBO1571431.1 hypothetical protein [Yersinia pseudotuberculosis]MBO1586383.1 hypothetical protein [Yersinia pseudotuberculosis]MBO1631791.1 hypothetical protein [Yersinia pseudotuberculosis]
MPLQLNDENICYMARYITIVFRDESIRFQRHAQKLSHAVLYSLAHQQEHYGADASAETCYQRTPFHTLLTTLEDKKLSVAARQAIETYLFTLPGASFRYQRFWWEARARRSHINLTRAVCLPLTHLIDNFTDVSQELAIRKQVSQLSSNSRLTTH